MEGPEAYLITLVFSSTTELTTTSKQKKGQGKQTNKASRYQTESLGKVHRQPDLPTSQFH